MQGRRSRSISRANRHHFQVCEAGQSSDAFCYAVYGEGEPLRLFRTFSEGNFIEAGIDTPYFQHAKNYMEVQPKPPAPVYAPEVVANAVLRAAEHPIRDITIGGGGRVLTALGAALPRLTDYYMERSMFDAQRSDAPAEQTGGNLYHSAGEEGMERGSYSGHVMLSSIYTQTALSPGRALLAAGVGLAVFAVIRSLANSGKD